MPAAVYAAIAAARYEESMVEPTVQAGRAPRTPIQSAAIRAAQAGRNARMHSWPGNGSENIFETSLRNTTSHELVARMREQTGHVLSPGRCDLRSAAQYSTLRRWQMTSSEAEAELDQMMNPSFATVIRASRGTDEDRERKGTASAAVDGRDRPSPAEEGDAAAASMPDAEAEDQGPFARVHQAMRELDQLPIARRTLDEEIADAAWPLCELNSTLSGPLLRRS